jgi:hypothetical protein
MAAVQLCPLRRVSLKIQAWRFCRSRPIPPLSVRVAVNLAVKLAVAVRAPTVYFPPARLLAETGARKRRRCAQDAAESTNARHNER